MVGHTDKPCECAADATLVLEGNRLGEDDTRFNYFLSVNWDVIRHSRLVICSQ